MQRVKFVGILNATPDSYFDGGQFDAVETAVTRVGELLNEGADIIDIGGESTGPGSTDVSVDEELSRVLPIIEAIRKQYPTAQLSIDTYKSEVAVETVDAGVMMVNDISAGLFDKNMHKALYDKDCFVLLMYTKDKSGRTTVDEKQYDNVVRTVADHLGTQLAAAESAGITRERLIIDPGMGHFVSSDPQYSFELIAHLQEFTKLAPVYVSPSRKSFLAGSEELSPADRLPGTIVASAIAAMNGASYIRTHDVAAVRRGCEVAMQLAQKSHPPEY